MGRRYTYDLFEPSPNNQDQSLKKLTEEFAPLHMKAWNENKLKRYNQPYTLNVASFVGMWFQKYMKVFMAYEAGKPVGFLMGVTFKPLEYRADVFQISDWYTGNNREMEDGLFDYVLDAVKILGCDQVWISYPDDQQEIDLGTGWKLVHRMKELRYSKE